MSNFAKTILFFVVLFFQLSASATDISKLERVTQ